MPLEGSLPPIRRASEAGSSSKAAGPRSSSPCAGRSWLHCTRAAADTEASTALPPQVVDHLRRVQARVQRLTGCRGSTEILGRDSGHHFGQQRTFLASQPALIAFTEGPPTQVERLPVLCSERFQS